METTDGVVETVNSGKTALERHLQSVAIVVVLGALGWTATTLLDLRDRASRTEVLLSTLTAQFSAQQTDKYTAGDHRRYELETDRRFGELTRRIDNVERRLGVSR